MARHVKPIPEDHHCLAPVLVVRHAEQAIAFYKNAFHARELARRIGPGGRIINAELRIGDSIFMLCEESWDMGRSSPPALEGTSVTLHLYVPDVDAAFHRALSAGAKVKRPMQNMFWGDRCGELTDPFGHVWVVAMRQEDLSAREIRERAEAYFFHPATA